MSVFGIKTCYKLINRNKSVCDCAEKFSTFKTPQKFWSLNFSGVKTGKYCTLCLKKRPMLHKYEVVVILQIGYI